MTTTTAREKGAARALSFLSLPRKHTKPKQRNRLLVKINTRTRACAPLSATAFFSRQRTKSNRTTKPPPPSSRAIAAAAASVALPERATAATMALTATTTGVHPTALHAPTHLMQRQQPTTTTTTGLHPGALHAAAPGHNVSLVEAVRSDHAAFRDVMLSIEATAHLGPREKLAAVFDLVRAVAQHSMAEELVLYPLARATLPAGQHATDVDLAFHRQLRSELSALSWCSPYDPALDAKLMRAWATLSEHMAEEERELLPALESAATPERLLAAGRMFGAAKMLAPTRPHVAAPMTPPLNLIASVFTAPLDWAMDLWRFGLAPPM